MRGACFPVGLGHQEKQPWPQGVGTGLPATVLCCHLPFYPCESCLTGEQSLQTGAFRLHCQSAGVRGGRSTAGCPCCVFWAPRGSPVPELWENHALRNSVSFLCSKKPEPRIPRAIYFCTVALGPCCPGCSRPPDASEHCSAECTYFPH